MTGDSMGKLWDAWGAYLDAAWSNGFPLVSGSVAESSPFNASPYVARLDDVLARLAGLHGRAFLRQPLTDLLDDLYDAGYAVDFLLAGGSFFDLANTSPKDFDALCLYRVLPNRTSQASVLTGARSRGLNQRMDLRFVAIDSEPLIYLKALSYFSILYSQQKPTATETHRPGILLMDARRSDAASESDS